MRIAPVIDIIALMLFAVAARLAHGGLSFSTWVDAVWLSTVVGGMALWMLVNGRLPHWSFLIVATVMSALFFFGWRLFARK